MAWFKRKDNNIQTATPKEMPEGVWIKVPTTGEMIHKRELEQHLYVDPVSDYHFRIGSKEYFDLLFEGRYTELGADILPTDPLDFTDRKKYKDRLEQTQEKTGLTDAVRIGTGTMNGISIVVGCMDFSFIGGSMGSVVGERLGVAIDYAREKKIPLIIISQTGGARMMESVLSLMQMAKTSAKLAHHAATVVAKDGEDHITSEAFAGTGRKTPLFEMYGKDNDSFWARWSERYKRGDKEGEFFVRGKEKREFDKKGN